MSDDYGKLIFVGSVLSITNFEVHQKWTIHWLAILIEQIFHILVCWLNTSSILLSSETCSSIGAFVSDQLWCNEKLVLLALLHVYCTSPLGTCTYLLPRMSYPAKVQFNFECFLFRRRWEKEKFEIKLTRTKFYVILKDNKNLNKLSFENSYEFFFFFDRITK